MSGGTDDFLHQVTVHMAKETYSYNKKRPIHISIRPCPPPGHYSYGKRDLFIWQKRPIHMTKRGLFTLASDYVLHQVTIHMAKETYLNGKKDLFI
jgi:hypothetical protein